MPAPVEWSAPDTVEPPAAGTVLTLDSTGAPRFVAAPPPPVSPPTRPTAPACPGSLRHARGRGAEVYAVWWSPRPDASAALLSARSDDGGRSWIAPVAVDSLDRGHAGCARPAPALAVDTLGGYVHVTYSLEAPEGAGVFFAHSMERGELFHAPVPIVYGERPAATAVTAHGDTVVVAYEDPNTRTPRIAVALSRTAGHIFEERLPPISSANATAASPQVAVRGRTIAVAWHAQPRQAAPGGAGQYVLRLGQLR